eukprot:gene5605-184_t
MFSRTARASAQLACRWMSTERALLRQPDPVVPKSLTGQYIALGATVAAAVFVYRTRQGIWYPIPNVDTE